MTLYEGQVYAVAAVCACLSTVRLSAWGSDVHQAVATLAEQRLTADTRRSVGDFLNGQRMAEVSTWADEVRDTTHRATYNWHFLNIPSESDRYEARRDCQPAERGDCIIAALERGERDLANPRLGRDRRREALMFVIHLVADLHQPLHVSNHDDRGGNGRPVVEIGGATNLHSAWDSGIVLASGKTTATLIADANSALRGRDERSIAKGTYVDWAMEMFDVTRRIVYAQVEGDGRITEPERQAAMQIITEQIARGGVRLAAVVERALRPPAPRQ